MTDLRFHRVSKRFEDGTEAVKDLTLEVHDGEFMVLVGPSGSGKTTVLRMAAGLDDVSSGVIEIGGSVVNEIPPRERDIAMVFQNYALFPHMTASENMSFGLRLRKTPRAESESRVRRASEMLGIDGVAMGKKPGVLSGGQRQRVAMGRAVVRQPRVFLMDEPLSNLDAQLRVQVRAEIQELQRSLNVTTLYVTHDQVEAMTLGDRVAVFREGVLQQVGTPQDLYLRPANAFVAAFVGSPAMNLLPGQIHRNGSATVISFEGGSCELDGSRLDVDDLGNGLKPGTKVMVGIRPEALRDAVPTDRDAGDLRGRVELVELLGADTLVHVSVGASAQDKTGTGKGTRVVARLGTEAHGRLRHGDPCFLNFDPGSVHLFDAATGRAWVLSGGPRNQTAGADSAC